MKKLLMLVIVFCLAVPVSSLNVHASSPYKDEVSVIVNGESLQYEGVFVENGRTLVPLRVILEKLGMTVVWNEKQQTIDLAKGKNKIWLKIGSKNAKVNGKTILLEAAPKIKLKKTYVPLRFISEVVGVPIEWVADSKRVYVGIIPKPIGNPKLQLPSGAKLVTSTRDEKTYTFVKQLPSGSKIEKVSVYYDFNNKLKVFASIKDKNNYGALAMFMPEDSWFYYSFVAVRPTIVEGDGEVIAEVLQQFYDAFNH